GSGSSRESSSERTAEKGSGSYRAATGKSFGNTAAGGTGRSAAGKSFGKTAESAGSKAASAAGLGYAVGDHVRHVKFGVGTVLAITDSGRDYLVTVDFPGWGIKKMYASFAKLVREQ
ncbi:MAG: ATP-dependent DNA helicase PcrA, partial [Lachnospiraceae bacterium]|nr:ATP-dependent DNA helicase PcrA [Lachnospiraceae bacterium]